MPCTYLSYTWKFVPFDCLHPISHPPSLPPPYAFFKVLMLDLEIFGGFFVFCFLNQNCKIPLDLLPDCIFSFCLF